jgi:hypothetical protein
LIVDPQSGDLFIVTKEIGKARVYTCPASRLQDKAVATLDYLQRLEFNKVTGAAISRNGNKFILRNEGEGRLWNRRAGESVAAALRRPPKKILVRDRQQGRQGEAIGFGPDGRSYFTVSEGKQPVICEFQLPEASGDSDR